jgi:hypothetical protein
MICNLVPAAVAEKLVVLAGCMPHSPRHSVSLYAAQKLPASTVCSLPQLGSPYKEARVTCRSVLCVHG